MAAKTHIAGILPSTWASMLGKMEETLANLLANEEQARKQEKESQGVDPGPNPKESRLLHRLDQRLGKLDACLGRAAQVAQKGEVAIEKGLNDIESWLEAGANAAKKLAYGAGNSVG